MKQMTCNLCKNTGIHAGVDCTDCGGLGWLPEPSPLYPREIVGGQIWVSPQYAAYLTVQTDLEEFILLPLGGSPEMAYMPENWLTAKELGEEWLDWLKGKEWEWRPDLGLDVDIVRAADYANVFCQLEYRF